MSPEAEAELVTWIAALTRQQITERLLHFQGDFPMDFTIEYLNRLPLERLQHLLMAAHMHHARKHQAGALVAH